MQTFTGIEYLKIDIANNFGLDKESFETRLAWVDAHEQELESYVDMADEPPLFLAGVMAFRKAQKGEPTGYLVGFDACSSGLQIMSTLIGCEKTAESTGLVDPNTRANIYGKVTEVMNTLLKNQGITVAPAYKEVKIALMTVFYGSRAKPKEIFGEDTPELAAFYEAMHIVAPGAYEVMQDMLASWNRDTLAHEWVMPDGFEVKIKTMYPIWTRIDVAELYKHCQVTHEFYENKTTNDYQEWLGDKVKDGISLAANITHSIDAMVVREMNRRCNYDRQQLKSALFEIEAFFSARELEGVAQHLERPNTFVSLAHIENMERAFNTLSMAELLELEKTINKVLSHKSFPLVCVHDEFKAHANNINRVRYWYKEILAELAGSNVLGDIFSQLHGEEIEYPKYNYNLPDLIRNSNYALS